MKELRVTASKPPYPIPAEGLSVDRLRTIVQDSHLSFLIGAGTPSAYFARLGNIEEALTDLSNSTGSKDAKALVRASLQGYFFEHVLVPNIALFESPSAGKEVRDAYEAFLRTVNRILLRRRSSLLGKQVNIFTTNIDMVFEVALEAMEIDANDGFSGKINPRLDLGEFNTLRFRQGARFAYRSEIPVVNLFKLHGSAGWRQGEDSTDIFFDHGLTLVKAVNKAYEAAKSELLPITDMDQVNAAALLEQAAGKSLSATGSEFAKKYNVLSIINPEKTKFATTVLNETYYELIRRFANELEKENSVLFVHGFSFRDEHLRDLVLRAARTNPTLQVIVFCYSRSDRESLKELLPPEQVKNGNVLFVTPVEPKEGAEERSLTLDVVREDYFDSILADMPQRPDHVIELQLSDESEELYDER